MNNKPSGLDAGIDTAIKYQISTSIVTSVVLAMLMVFGLWDQLSHESLTYWLAMLLAISTLRLITVHLLPKHGKYFQFPLTFIAGSIWGAVIPLFLAGLDTTYQILPIIILVGLVAGSSNAYAGRMQLFYAFMLPLLVPLSIWLFSQNAKAYTMLGIADLFYMLALSIIAYRNTQLLNGSVQKNIQLAEEMRLREIHEQRLETARRQEAQLVSIVEHSNDLIFAHHLDGIIFTANAASKEQFGGEIIGKNVFDIVAPEHLSRIKRKIEATIMDEGNTIYEVEAIDLFGRRHYLEINAKLIRADGKPVAMHAIARDMTVRKEAEKKLDLLIQAINASHEAIMVMDAEGMVEFANPAAAVLYRKPLDQTIGSSAANLRGGQPGDAIYKDIITTISHGDTWSGEISFHPHDNEDCLVARRISPIMDKNGRIHHQICIDRDITEARQRNRQMEHTQRLESLGILAGGIAHDFNNLLTAILGNATMAERCMKRGGDVQTHLSRISTISQRAAELCKQMLAYSGKGHFAIKPVNLSEQIREMSRLMEVSISKHVHMRYDLHADIPLIDADRGQLQQIILNMITNANEAIDNRPGEIVFSSGLVQAKQKYLAATRTGEQLPAGKYVYFEVSDNGCGMDDATMEKMFDPFFTTKFTGRGLGMSAMLGIVRGHHGAILVDSQTGEGTTFRVLLPISATASQVQNAINTDNSGIDDCQGIIMVVDDEEPIREVAAIMLQDMGFDILTACDGIEAVDLYRRHHADVRVVLLDMTMPKMDGRTCFTELLKINPGVRVVLSSGYNAQEINKQFADQHPSGFIQKPYTLKALQQKMKEILRNDTIAPP